MRIAFGADDDSPTVDAVLTRLRELGHEVATADDTVPWPMIARDVAEAVAAGRADAGVVLCWTGTGTSIAANKVDGVRAALAWEPWIAENARRWNDANVLALSLRRTAPDVAVEILDAFLAVDAPDDDERENIALLEADGET
jgi:ribose 5-phosphate isomerase B